MSRQGEAAERTYVHVVSGNYFTVLGAQPMMGRLFLPGKAGQQARMPSSFSHTTHGRTALPPTRTSSANR
jgi:hypothetical protein